MHTIHFANLTAICYGYVETSDGLLFLRMAGHEATVNAIWARLSASDYRGKSHLTQVKIKRPGQRNLNVAAEKRVRYRMLRTRLPSGFIDMALIHPRITTTEDRPEGFTILGPRDSDQPPPGFFQRLNHCLAIPLKPEWEPWLWAGGQQKITFDHIATITSTDRDGQEQTTTTTTRARRQPIQALTSAGGVQGYTVNTGRPYQHEAWLQLIRDNISEKMRFASPIHRG